MVFREGPVDGVSANLFATHIGIAIDALDRIEALTRNIATLEGGVAQDAMDRWAYEWAKGWQDAWDQLGEARTIVARFGRDVSRFDEARATAGDIYLDAASGRAVQVARTVHMSWQTRSTEPAKRAIAALRAAMPEVVVSGPTPAPPVDIEVPADVAPASDPRTPWWKTGIILAILAIVIYYCIKAR